MRLVALLSAKSFILFSLSRFSRVGELYLQIVSQSEYYCVCIEASQSAIIIKHLNLFNSLMRPALPNNPQTTQSVVVKSLKPLIYNFFISQKPGSLEQSIQDLDINCYKSFHSQKLQAKAHSFFKPTIQSKKLIDQPKFLLSVERKKIKIMNGISQRASSEKPSRNSYRGSKVRNNTKTMVNYEEPDTTPRQLKERPIDSQQRSCVVSPRKAKQPNLHFNLRHVLQTRRSYNLQFSHAQNIQGSNFAYYNYFSSEKSSLPKTQRSSRQKPITANAQKRYLSTTMGVRVKPIVQNL